MDPEVVRSALEGLIRNFRAELQSGDLRHKVLSLVPAFRTLRDLGCALVPETAGTAARDRILCYLRQYPMTVVGGDELMVVSGIQEWARRVRELRVQFGWRIVNGVTAREMEAEGESALEEIDVQSMGPTDYVLLSTEEDRDAAHRWNVANEIRKSSASVRDKILRFMRSNTGTPVSGEELRYVAKDRTEWARRVRELRTEYGWPVVTKNTGRPDLPVGVYLLEADRQSPEHDRHIPDPIRREVLRRDSYACKDCGWNHHLWNRSDARHLELHHVQHHAEGGKNVQENLTTLCTICHDERHRREVQ